MKTLAEYMKETRTTDAALAAILKCERSHITKIRQRRSTPSLTLAIAINKHTKVDFSLLVAQPQAQK